MASVSDKRSGWSSGLRYRWVVLLLGWCGLLASCATQESTTHVATVVADVPPVAAPAAVSVVQQVDERVYRGGRPDAAMFRRLRELGVETVVTFSEDAAALPLEKELAVAEGMEVVSIPVSVDREPTEEEVLLFLGTVLAPERQPVYLHCDNGRDRTGAMVAMYRVVVGGWEIQEAYEEAKVSGFWPYRGDAGLHRFVHQLKDHPQYFEWARELASAPVEAERAL